MMQCLILALALCLPLCLALAMPAAADVNGIYLGAKFIDSMQSKWSNGDVNMHAALHREVEKHILLPR